MDDSAHDQRQSIVETIFPDGIPQLWCPLLTHYRDTGGSLDPQRVRAHLRYLAPVVKTFLAPGSTGDGWEMSPQRQDELIALLLELSAELDLKLMIGVLRSGRGEARDAIVAKTAELLGEGHSWELGTIAAELNALRVSGFTVTPPKGSALTQSQIYSELAAVGELGVPVAFYQLPQITENEMAPETVAELAARYPGFYMLKDTSGADRVAMAAHEHDYQGLFLVRGAERDYAAWHRRAGGPYDGFLLSTVNCFAHPLAEILTALREGCHETARSISVRISAVAEELFSAAAELPFGNPFSNANRAIDHVFAYGEQEALTREPPATISGNRLPHALIERAAQALQREGFDTRTGYLE